MSTSLKSRVWQTFQEMVQYVPQGFVKGEVFCFRYPYFYFRYGESTCTASQQSSTASQLSKDLNKVPLLLQNLGLFTIFILDLGK